MGRTKKEIWPISMGRREYIDRLIVEGINSVVTALHRGEMAFETKIDLKSTPLNH